MRDKYAYPNSVRQKRKAELTKCFQRIDEILGKAKIRVGMSISNQSDLLGDISIDKMNLPNIDFVQVEIKEK